MEWNDVRNCVNPFITNESTGESWLIVRPLQLGDYAKGFTQLLSQLTSVGNISKPQFDSKQTNKIKELIKTYIFPGQFYAMQRSGGYYVTVIEDTRKGEIIGAATLITELKFIHDCGLRARLEDVVVNNTYRGKQLGKLIVLTVSLLAKKLGCYKMSLDCKDSLIPFYKAIGYKCEPGNCNSMVIRYEGVS